ncbi:MAG: UMP kinase [Candidatus Moraniibacteriota bacterium]
MKHDQSKRFLISVGGSLVVPNGGIDTNFVKRFHDCIVSRVQDGYSFILVVGGGKTARNYIDAASKVHSIENDDQDWLGIHATRMNAHFLRTIFREWAHPRINTNPHDLEDFYQAKEPIIVAGGWRPGFSTDYIATVLAKYLDFKTIINLSNTDGVYEADPRKRADAKRFDRLGWSEFRKLVGNTWSPGMSAPFDPVASKLAEEEGFSVVVMNGSDIDNLERYFLGEDFVGTMIA